MRSADLGQVLIRVVRPESCGQAGWNGSGRRAELGMAVAPATPAVRLVSSSGSRCRPTRKSDLFRTSTWEPGVVKRDRTARVLVGTHGAATSSVNAPASLTTWRCACALANPVATNGHRPYGRLGRVHRTRGSPGECRRRRTRDLRAVEWRNRIPLRGGYGVRSRVRRSTGPRPRARIPLGAYQPCNAANRWTGLDPLEAFHALLPAP